MKSKKEEVKEIKVCSKCGRVECSCDYCEECRIYHPRPVWEPGRACTYSGELIRIN